MINFTVQTDVFVGFEIKFSTELCAIAFFERWAKTLKTAPSAYCGSDSYHGYPPNQWSFSCRDFGDLVENFFIKKVNNCWVVGFRLSGETNNSFNPAWQYVACETPENKTSINKKFTELVKLRNTFIDLIDWNIPIGTPRLFVNTKTNVEETANQ
ncbi:MAG TPA: hypothetical protein VMV86_04320 [Methanosarcinales archaeon]|nr:hypothetical protein [Methanosarcinales archaeon]